MGLDLFCNGISEKVGAYSSVHRIRFELLCGLKYYLEIEHETEIKLIDYLTKLVKTKDQVNYQLYSVKMERMLSKLGVNGFSSFIYHSDCDGTMNSYEAGAFLQTWDKTKDYMTDTVREKDGSFFLDTIFQQSKLSGETIFFC